ncbi:hypothetical protein N0V88_002763 [Collariella sp. IMI 366227]|nr:hypothetical protein N0V88_002763 [Collariella sp. IMI 366227]
MKKLLAALCLDPECGPEFGKRAFYKTIKSQVDALRKQSGSCHAEANNCTKIACTMDGAIKWCNDGDKAISKACSEIAMDAERVMLKCKHADKKRKKTWTRGQVRDSGSSRVIVNKGECSKGAAGGA